MEKAKTMKIPMSASIKLDEDEKGKSIDSTMYRGMISSLLHLTASRPDIMYSVCLRARFQSYPKESHLSVVKRILKYLKGTMDIGLCFSASSNVDPSSFLHVQGFRCEPLSSIASTPLFALAPSSMAPRQEPTISRIELNVDSICRILGVPTFGLRIYESKVWPTIPIFELKEVIQRICGLSYGHGMGKPSARILIVIYRVFHHIGTIYSNIIHRALLLWTSIHQMDLSAKISSLGTHIEEFAVRIDRIEDHMKHQHEEMMVYLHFVFPLPPPPP
ncbi:hypothetical protein AAG906_015585 [Vitis piasezkii]